MLGDKQFLASQHMIECLATVITNLLSAIPWIGQDFVQFTTILFLAACIFIVSSFIIYYSFLPTIGKVSVRALRGAKDRTPDQKLRYKNISYEFLAIFVGFVDGDGYIKINKTARGNISLELVISVDMRDKSTLEYFYSILEVGRLYTYKTTVKYIIGKVDLQEVLFPLMAEHKVFFLTDTRRFQYSMALYILYNNVVKFEEISCVPAHLATIPALPTNAKDYVSLPFFTNWFVGFVIAEGSFYKKSSGEFFFSVRQRTHHILFIAFSVIFDTSRKIDISSIGYSQFTVSSVKDLGKVISFFSFSNVHPLVGYKKSQYIEWVNEIRNTYRFRKVKLPK